MKTFSICDDEKKELDTLEANNDFGDIDIQRTRKTAYWRPLYVPFRIINSQFYKYRIKVSGRWVLLKEVMFTEWFSREDFSKPSPIAYPAYIFYIKTERDPHAELRDKNAQYRKFFKVSNPYYEYEDLFGDYKLLTGNLDRKIANVKDSNLFDVQMDRVLKRYGLTRELKESDFELVTHFKMKMEDAAPGMLDGFFADKDSE